MGVRAGKLRHSITVQELTNTKDSFNQTELVYQDFLTARADIIPITSNDVFTADQRDVQATHRVLMRYRDGIRGGFRVVFGSRTYEIVSILPDRTFKNYINILCREIFV